VLKMLAISALVVGSAVAAQPITSYKTNRPAPITGDSDKIVCEKEEKIGTRLGATKVCLTVAEWRARHLADRDETERTQQNTRVCGEGSCPAGDPF